MLIVAPQTISNAGVLETRSLPKKFFGRVQLFPKGAGFGLWARLILEIQFLRYMAALVPFIAIPFMSNDLALPVTQAPLAMVLVIAVVEMRVLRLTDRARQRCDEDEAARRVDAFTFRARPPCGGSRRGGDRGGRGHAGRRTVRTGACAAPDAGVGAIRRAGPHVMDLDPEDRAILQDTLFDEDLHRTDAPRVPTCARISRSARSGSRRGASRPMRGWPRR
jgi:hypothetical protein